MRSPEQRRTDSRIRAGARYPDGVGSPSPPDDEVARIQAAGADQDEAVAEAFERHRARLLRMVEMRIHPAVRGRVSASDVLQETYLDVSGRIADYLQDPRMPFFLWVRFLTAQKLMALHRRHLGAQKRDARRQVSRGHPGFPSASSVTLVKHLLAQGTTPTQAVAQGEMRLQLEEALDDMGPADREVLVLRHFEELTNVEAARELGIEPPAASKRYVRALKRLRTVLEEHGLPPGASEA